MKELPSDVVAYKRISDRPKDRDHLALIVEFPGA